STEPCDVARWGDGRESDSRGRKYVVLKRLPERQRERDDHVSVADSSPRDGFGRDEVEREPRDKRQDRLRLGTPADEAVEHEQAPDVPRLSACEHERYDERGDARAFAEYRIRDPTGRQRRDEREGGLDKHRADEQRPKAEVEDAEP